MSDPLNIIERDKLRKAWLEALRSGKYKQGRNNLRTSDDHYCCLGVLCSVAGLKDAGIGFEGSRSELYTCLLPEEVREVVGLSRSETVVLMTMNDEQQKPFIQIADYLEKEVFND